MFQPTKCSRRRQRPFEALRKPPADGSDLLKPCENLLPSAATF